MSIHLMQQDLREGKPLAFPTNFNSQDYAASLDAQDTLSHLRSEFIIPTKASVRGEPVTTESEPTLYFVGNSLGPQPVALKELLITHLNTWAGLGVNGHFRTPEGSLLPAWQDLAASCAEMSTDLLGASASELVLMNSLTANLHLMLASFYRPQGARTKIIMEWKPFPSDIYAVKSQLAWHGLSEENLILIEPDNGSIITTKHILKVIQEHKDTTALLMLPGIQYYTGQLFEIEPITRYAKERGLTVGWDLAHAAGNVELKMHDWDVDFAVWCTYKYINAGPGAIAGAFVHERHGGVEKLARESAQANDDEDDQFEYRPRLAGWYGNDRSSRFQMRNTFQPTPGASGYQLSNPSAIDLVSLKAALSVFSKTSMKQLRSKSLVMTAYAEALLDKILVDTREKGKGEVFEVLTPREAMQRGTQLSVKFREGLMEGVARALEEAGVVVDQRRPDVIRVAPVPLYTRFEDVWKFMQIMRKSLEL